MMRATPGTRRSFELFAALMRKDFKVRYRNTFLGFFWSLINPLCYGGAIVGSVTAGYLVWQVP